MAVPATSTTPRSLAPEPYFQDPHSGPRCSSPASARLRERRFAMGYEERPEPEHTQCLARRAVEEFLRYEPQSPALARARAMHTVVSECSLSFEKDALLVGGEDPYLFNLMLPCLHADRYEAFLRTAPADPVTRTLREHTAILGAPCFEGHITPGLETILGQGTEGLRMRIREARASLDLTSTQGRERDAWYQAALLSCDNLDLYATRLRDGALDLAARTLDAEWAAQLQAAARSLERVPSHPAQTLREALQAYWLAYILATIEMGGCCPGGGLGLGRPDQYLYPYYEADLREGRLTRDEALELVEVWLLNFRHVDYYTPHAVFTPGSQASIGGVTPTGADASNDLTELIMEASLRIQMPAPYISLRLHRDAPERFWQAATNYIVGGLGFSIVNDEALVPAFLKHGRSLADARDYICSCCYEFTIPGREAFNPNGCFINLAVVLEAVLNEGRSLLSGAVLSPSAAPPSALVSFEDLCAAFETRLDEVLQRAVEFVNRADAVRTTTRAMPLMSLFIEPCVERGVDICAGGARYNLTGMIVAGLPNVVNALAALREVVFEDRAFTLAEVVQALRDDFVGCEPLRRRLLAAPKWGNADPAVDALARRLSDRLYSTVRTARNARGGRWQLALYSFVANHDMGRATGASADGRQAGEPLTRNLNPSWGTDHQGPTAVLRSLSAIDFTQFPNGGTLDLRFDPAPLVAPSGRQLFAGFLKAFVDLGVMQMQVSMVDTETLLDARAHPERWPNLMVKVAGYSARFVDLSEREKDEIIGRSLQRL